MIKSLTRGLCILGLLVGLAYQGPVSAQGLSIGATVASGGACPGSSVLSPGVGRFVYQTNGGALCVYSVNGGGGGGTAGGGALSELPFTPTSASSNDTITTTTSAPANGTALPSGSAVLLYSTSAVWVAFNTSNTTNVTSSSLALPANTPIVITVGSNTYISAMGQTAGGTLTVAGGSITVPTSITGTLPAFASTPTFNCGTGCSSTTPPGVISPTVSIAATSTSSNVGLTTTGSPTQVNVCNQGPNLAFFALGVGSGTTATTTSLPLGVGACFPEAIGSNTYIAAITAVAGQTATVYATSTTGVLSTGYNGAQSGNPLYVFTSTGYVQVTGISSATGFTPPTGSVVCYVYAEGANARYRTDGTNPTASIGVPLNQYSTTGASLTLTASLSTVKFIPITGTLTIDADCYK